MANASISRPGRAPVVLVHGLLSNAASLFYLRRCLRTHGFPVVEVFGYGPLGRPVLRLAEGLGRRVERLLSVHAAPRLHVVGHSLGGLVARAYTQLAGGDAHVLSCVTIGTPHRGLALANFARGALARDLRPWSELFRRLESAPASPDVYFSSFYGARDRLVRPAPLANDGPFSSGTVVGGLGHVGLLFSTKVGAALADELDRAERTTSDRRPAELMAGVVG